jgi:hypothetical protein
MDESAASLLIDSDASEYVTVERIPKQMDSFLSVDCNIYSQAERKLSICAQLQRIHWHRGQSKGRRQIHPSRYSNRR